MLLSFESDPCETTPVLALGTITPGIRAARPFNVRPPGSVSICSFVSTVCESVFLTSTTGEAPDTVMVSSSAPTRRSAFTSALNAPISSMPSRLMTLNPVSVKDTT